MSQMGHEPTSLGHKLMSAVPPITDTSDPLQVIAWRRGLSLEDYAVQLLSEAVRRGVAEKLLSARSALWETSEGRSVAACVETI